MIFSQFCQHLLLTRNPRLRFSTLSSDHAVTVECLASVLKLVKKFLANIFDLWEYVGN